MVNVSNRTRAILRAAGVLAITAAALQCTNAAAPTGPRPINSPDPSPTGGASKPRPVDPTRTAIPAVEAAVQAARDGAALPTRLVPPPADLRDDRYGPGPTPPCWALRDDPRLLEKCTLFGDGPRGTIALVGDSHAQEWLPAIAWMAERDGWNLVPLWHQGCWPATYDAGRECEEYFRWAEDEVRTLQPDVVLLGGTLTYATQGVIDHTTRGISSLVAAMGPDAGRVVVIGDPPALEFQPDECLLGGGATLATCTSTLSPAQISVYLAAERATTHAGAAFLDTISWFCFERQCPSVVGHTVTYREHDHITATYATERRGLFRDAFIQGVAKAP